jgi:hypothetical protein
MLVFFSSSIANDLLQQWLWERFNRDISDATLTVTTGIPFAVAMYIEDLFVDSSEAWVDHLAALTAAAGCDAVTDSRYGSTHIHIDRAGSAWDVRFNEDNRELRGPRQFSEAFSAAVALPDNLVLLLAPQLGASPEQIEITVEEVMERDPCDRDPLVIPVASGTPFPFRCRVSVAREREAWLPDPQRAQRWVAVVAALAVQLNVELLVHHDSFTQIRNIPGGSDTDVHAIRVGPRGASIVRLKRCRLRW